MYLYALNNRAVHITMKRANRNKLLFLALILSFFSFAGAVSTAQQSKAVTHTELTLSANCLTKSSAFYKIAKPAFNFNYLDAKANTILAGMAFNTKIKTRYICISKRHNLIKSLILIPLHITIPHVITSAEPQLRLS